MPCSFGLILASPAQEVVFMGTQQVHPNCDKDGDAGPWEYTWGDPENGGAVEGEELGVQPRGLLL